MHTTIDLLSHTMMDIWVFPGFSYVNIAAVSTAVKVFLQTHDYITRVNIKEWNFWVIG